VGHITRRVLMVHLGKMPLDDKDYYGNKRLEVAGNLLSLLFEGAHLDYFRVLIRVVPFRSRSHFVCFCFCFSPLVLSFSRLLHLCSCYFIPSILLLLSLSIRRFVFAAFDSFRFFPPAPDV
jgi:hypothetical protein